MKRRGCSHYDGKQPGRTAGTQAAGGCSRRETAFWLLDGSRPLKADLRERHLQAVAQTEHGTVPRPVLEAKQGIQ